MSHSANSGRRIGRDQLLEVAANLFEHLTFPDVTSGFLKPTDLARAAEVQPGTVRHHFGKNVRSDRGLPYEALRRALARVGKRPVDEAGTYIEAAAEKLRDGDPAEAKAEIARALEDDMRTFSPDEGPSDPVVEAEELAFFLAVATAPHDPLAAEEAQGFCRPMREVYERSTARLLRATGRRFRGDFDGPSFAVATTALCDGFVWLRRFDRERAPTALYSRAWIRLFEACTLPSDELEDLDFTDEMPRPGGVDVLRRQAIIEAARALYDTKGWTGITITEVASLAGVSRPTVTANVGDRDGLAAAVYTRHLPMLQEMAARAATQSLTAGVRSILRNLAEVATDDRELTAAFLDGVYRYTVKNGPPKRDDPVDPRVLIPLPSLLIPLLEAHQLSFRRGHADTEEERRDSAALLVNGLLHLCITRPELMPSAVAERICETTFAGMLKRRPS